MQLVCPSCAATYSVPDALIGTGRNMRCVRCQHDWFAAPQAEVAMAAAVPTAPPVQVAPAPARPLSKPPVTTTRNAQAAPAAAPLQPLLILAWLASLGLVAAGGWALWAYRAPLAEFWPPLLRLYTLLGA